MDTNIMDLDIENLSNQQYIYLKEHTISILNDIISKLKSDNLQDIKDMLVFSAAGDGWGYDNYYINFAYKTDEKLDLYDIIIKMADLKHKILK